MSKANVQVNEQEVKSKVERITGVLLSDVTVEDNGLHVYVVAHSDSIKNVSLSVFKKGLEENLKDVVKGMKIHTNIIPVKVDTPLEMLRRELQEVEGVLGVYTNPLEWNEQKQVTKAQVVINVNEQKFDDLILQEKFNKLVKTHNVRVGLKVDFVLFNPKNKSNIIL